MVPTMYHTNRIALAIFFVAALESSSHAQDNRPAGTVPTAKEMAVSPLDVWAEAAIRQPDGPSYEFYKDLLPPLRYVNTEFRHYPIVLGTPGGTPKIRYVSNGSAVNARANKKPMWKEGGVPVHFFVGHGEGQKPA